MEPTGEQKSEVPPETLAGWQTLGAPASVTDAPALISDRQPSETPDQDMRQGFETGLTQQVASAEGVEPSSIFSRIGRRIRQVWHEGSYDFYIPVVTWHNRFTYDSVTKYNEKPWGAGIGKSIIDEDGDTHLLYALGFSDSHARFQPYMGYAYRKNYYFDEARDWSVGAGMVLGITGRYEYNYIPIPLPLPYFGVQYKNIALEGVYIPGGKNDGNVLFSWVRLHLDF